MPIRELRFIAEQTPTLLEDLRDDEAAALQNLGLELRYGTPQVLPEDDDNVEHVVQASAIELTRRPGERGWRILVRNAVGLIGVNDRQIVVEPKIPLEHFTFLDSLGSDSAHLRLADRAVNAESAGSYLASVWIAFLNAVAIALQADLHHDYEEHRSELTYIRGTLDVRRTTLNLARGVLRFPAIYDDLTVDNPTNRQLLAACRRIAGDSRAIASSGLGHADSPQLAIYQRIEQRARRAAYQLSQASELRPEDLTLPSPRLAPYQRHALELARHVLGGVGRTVRFGRESASCFLYPTYPVIESGIRQLLNKSLAANFSVNKGSRAVAGLSFTPDLVFQTHWGQKYSIVATGDVKYRLRDDDWPRSVLEQAVVFAEVFEARHGLFIDFHVGSSARETRSVCIRGRTYHRISWPANSDVSPTSAASFVTSECARLLGDQSEDASESVSG